MARRNDHSREQLKQLAIDAGGKMIAEQGLKQFSIRNVAKNIGYTVGTLYHSFSNCDALILQINAQTLENMYQDILNQHDDKQHGAEAIKHLANVYLHFAQTHYHRWSALFEFNLPQEMALPTGYTEKVKQLFELIETPLLPLFNNNPQTAQQAAKVLWAGIHGIAQLEFMGKLNTVSTDSIQTLITSLIDHYLNGLIASEETQ